MEDYFEFRNKSAHMRFALRRKSRWEREDVVRYNFIFENVDDLAVLLSMNADESVTLDDETMPFSQFREEYLSKANRIYVDKETEFMDMFASADVPNTLEKLAKRK